jgi:hypothetical protein
MISASEEKPGTGPPISVEPRRGTPFRMGTCRGQFAVSFDDDLIETDVTHYRSDRVTATQWTRFRQSYVWSKRTRVATMKVRKVAAMSSGASLICTASDLWAMIS